MIPKWSRIFYVAIVTVSLLVSFTVAVDMPAAKASSSGASTRPPSVYDYIHSLDVNKINGLPSTFSRTQDRFEDPTRPFYGRTPLYSVAAAPDVVQQALRDHQSVGIVDPARRQVALIRWESPKIPTNPTALLEQPRRSGGPGHLVLEQFEKPEEVLRVFSLDPSFHSLKKALVPFAHRGLRADRDYVDDFVHVRGRPILPRSATHRQMVGASLQDLESFYMAQDSNRYVLIKPRTDHMVEPVNAELHREIAEVRNLHYQDTQRYGPAFASLKWGRPLDQMPRFAGGRVPRASNLPRLGRDATHLQMVDALATHGGFRFHKGNRLYTATVISAGTSTGGRQLSVSVDEGRKVSKLKDAAKWFQNKVHL